MSSEAVETDTGADADRAHNVKDLHGIIQDTAKKLLAVDKQIDDAKARHIAPLNEEKNEIKKTFKAKTGMALADFDVHYRKLKRLDTARNFLDEDEGPKVLDDNRVIAEAFAKLDEGMQVDWVAAVTGDEREEPEDEDEGNGFAALSGVDKYNDVLARLDPGHKADVVIVAHDETWMSYSAGAQMIGEHAGLETGMDRDDTGEIMAVEIPPTKYKACIETLTGDGLNVTVATGTGDLQRFEKVSIH